MGLSCGNLTLHGVRQEELVDYLSEVGREAYVLPTFNRFTTVYDKAVEQLGKDGFAKIAKLYPRAKAVFNQYLYSHVAVLVCLATHLSERFTCLALAIYINDGDNFWYHLCQNGFMLDEYTTCRDDVVSTIKSQYLKLHY